MKSAWSGEISEVEIILVNKAKTYTKGQENLYEVDSTVIIKRDSTK